MPRGNKDDGGGGGGGGGGDAASGGEHHVCCARRGCEREGKKRCGGCKQVKLAWIIVCALVEECVKPTSTQHGHTQLTLSCNSRTVLPPSFFRASAGAVLHCRVPKGALERGWPQEGVQGSAGCECRRKWRCAWDAGPSLWHPHKWAHHSNSSEALCRHSVSPHSRRHVE
jgi:hypothetical protein